MPVARMAVVDGDGHVNELRGPLAAKGWTASGGTLIDALLDDHPDQTEDVGLGPSMARAFIKSGVRKGAFDGAARLEDMDTEGIARAINYPSVLLAVSDIPDVPSSV